MAEITNETLPSQVVEQRLSFKRRLERSITCGFGTTLGGVALTIFGIHHGEFAMAGPLLITVGLGTVGYGVDCRYISDRADIRQAVAQQAATAEPIMQQPEMHIPQSLSQSVKQHG